MNQDNKFKIGDFDWENITGNDLIEGGMLGNVGESSGYMDLNLVERLDEEYGKPNLIYYALVSVNKINIHAPANIQTISQMLQNDVRDLSNNKENVKSVFYRAAFCKIGCPEIVRMEINASLLGRIDHSNSDCMDVLWELNKDAEKMRKEERIQEKRITRRLYSLEGKLDQ